MFSLDNFYNIIDKNLLCVHDYKIYLCKQNINDIDYNKQSSVPADQLYEFSKIDEYTHELFNFGNTKKILFLFNDQEPVYSSILLQYSPYLGPWFPNKKEIFVNSEISQEKNELLNKLGMVDWYYFFHGFASLFWYSDLKYLPKQDIKRIKVFSCYNNLISGFRNYRLYLISMLEQKNLIKHGSVSCNLQDQFGTWKTSVMSPNLSKNAKYAIYNTFSKFDSPLTADKEYTHGKLSADTDFDDINNCHWHVVTETVFFQDKLHLTEKVFKPIANRLPFILVAAPGNLAYLKSYGFKTFDRWIDESYDNETDPEKRIGLIVQEIEKLCNLSEDELNTITNEVQDVVDYNFNWFYGGFKELIVNEMVDNYIQALDELNVDHSLKLDEIKHRLKQ